MSQNDGISFHLQQIMKRFQQPLVIVDNQD
jgi:hypothetical protein